MARLKAGKGLSILVALALTLSLGAVAVPMARTVGAEDPATLHVNAVNGTIGIYMLCPPVKARGSAIYKDIQKAINCALPGDTIMVHPGKYTENLIINKSLTLQSTDGWQNTTIDPVGDSIIWIEGEVDVTVQGFEITAGTHGIYIPQLNSTVNISGCFIHGNVNDGIHINNVPEEADVTIVNNFIVDNGDDGIEVAEAGSVNGSVTIEDNIIGAWRYDSTAFDGNNDNGIHVGHVSSTGNVTIEGNAISENGADGINFGFGVMPISGSVGIRDNFIGAWTCYDGDYGYSGAPQRYHGNGDKGIEISQVGESGASGTVIIEGNKISENPTRPDLTGIYIGNIYGVVTIAGNDIGAWKDDQGGTYLGNRGDGVYIDRVYPGAVLTIGPDNSIKENTDDGIEIFNAQPAGAATVTVHHNTIDDNGSDGIELGTPLEVDGATISHNTITNHDKGIHMTGPSDQNIISDNEIRDNDHGIWVEGDDNQILRNDILNNKGLGSGIHLTSTAEGNIINCNNIEGNLPYGVHNENVEEVVDATNNWWGDKSGPSGAGPGSGDAVSENVTYAPWLPTEFQYCPECGGTPPIGPPVGGEAYPVNKLGILAPWIALIVASIAGATITWRRRSAQG
jgi:parallel beta-helix repeat protein